MKFNLVGLIFILSFVNVVLSKKTSHGDIPPAIGEGSSLPFPLYSRLNFGWDQRDPGNTVEYYQTSAAAGIASLIGPKSERKTFWAGSEVLPTEAQLNTSKANGRTLKWHPSALISLMPFVNYDSLGSNVQLKMTPLTFGMIWMGNISRWNDPILVETNPFLASVDQPILLVTAVSKSGTYGIFQQSLLNMLPPGTWPYPVRTDGTWTPQHLAVLGNRVVYAPIGNPATFATIFETPYSMGIVSQSLLLELGVGVNSFAFLSSSDKLIIPDSNGLLAASDTLIVSSSGTAITNVSIPDGIWPIYGYTYVMLDTNYTGYTPEECQAVLSVWRYIRWMLLDPSARIEALNIGAAMLKLSIAEAVLTRNQKLECNGFNLLDYTYEDQRTGASWDAMLSVAMICLVVPFLLGVAAIFRYKKSARAGFLFFLFSTLSGAVLLLVSVILFYLLPDQNSICILRTWFVGIGFVLLIVPIVSKILWCLILVRMSTKFKSSDVSWQRLAIPLVIAVLLQVVLLILWTSIDPYNSTTVITDPYVGYAIYVCSSESNWTWFGIEIGCFVGLCTFSFILYCINSNKQVRNMHDVSWSQFTIYNILIFMIILIPLLSGFENSEEAQYYMITIGLILPSLFTCLTLYGPIVLPSLFKAFGTTISRSTNKSTSRSNNSGGTKSKHDTELA